MNPSTSLIPPKVLSPHKHLMAPAAKVEFLRLMDIFLIKGCATIEEAVTGTLYRLRVSPARLANWIDWQRHTYGCLKTATYRALLLLRAGILEHAIITLVHVEFKFKFKFNNDEYIHHAGWVGEHPPRSKWELRY